MAPPIKSECLPDGAEDDDGHETDDPLVTGRWTHRARMNLHWMSGHRINPMLPDNYHHTSPPLSCDEESEEEFEDQPKAASEEDIKEGPKEELTSRMNLSPSPTEQKMEPDTEHSKQEEQFYHRPSIRFPLSDNLKSLIVDDWERVSKNATVVALPAPRPVRKIWDDYYEEEVPKRTSRIERACLHEIHVGLLEYFDVMLDKVLLYNYERPQYRALRKEHSGKENCGPIDIYGAEHFLRLLSMFHYHPHIHLSLRKSSCLTSCQAFSLNFSLKPT